MHTEVWSIVRQALLIISQGALQASRRYLQELLEEHWNGHGPLSESERPGENLRRTCGVKVGCRQWPPPKGFERLSLEPRCPDARCSASSLSDREKHLRLLARLTTRHPAGCRLPDCV